MFSPSKEQLELMSELDLSYRFSLPSSEDWRGFVKCEVIDRTTSTPYITGRGVDPPLALSDALEKARKTPKPLTRAQAAVAAAAEVARDEEVDSLKRQIAALEAQLKTQPSASAGKFPKGRDK